MADEEWGEIDTSPKSVETEKVEFELEEEASPETEVEEEAPEIELEADEEDNSEEIAEKVTEEPEEPKELEGIETQGAQKRIRNLVKQRKEKESENEQLRQRIAEYEQKVKEQEEIFAHTQQNNLQTSETHLTEQLALAEAGYRTALESGDADEILQAQKIYNKAEYNLRDVGLNKERFNQAIAARRPVQPEARNTNVVEDRPYAPDPQDFDPKAVEWASENEWFGKDQVMTAAALAINNKLMEEGYDPADEDFYETIDKELRTTLPSKFKSEEEVPEVEAPKKSPQVVGGASRTVASPSTGRSNKVRLTKADVEIAKKWGIPLERYAKQKLAADKADGEYTEIIT